MMQTFDFLLLTSEKGEVYDRIEPCVVYHRTIPDFILHAEKLSQIVDQVIPSIESQIDKTAIEIQKEYKTLPISDVLMLNLKEPRFANMDDVFSKRID